MYQQIKYCILYEKWQYKDKNVTCPNWSDGVCLDLSDDNVLNV